MDVNKIDEKKPNSESEDDKRPQQNTYQLLSNCFNRGNVKSMFNMIKYVKQGDICAEDATRLLQKLKRTEGTLPIIQKLIELGAQKTIPTQSSDTE